MGRDELLDLIEGAKKGETEYLEKLYSVSYNRVYFYAFKIFGNVEDAADIVQDVFIIVFTKIRTLKEPLAYFNWLTKIIVNCCNQKKRKEYRDRDAIITGEENTLAETIADDSFSVEDIAEGHAIRSYILGIIDILPDEQKRTVLLYYYEKLTLSQIAEIEDVAVATIKSRLYYAREKIKRSMRAEEKRTGIRLYSFGAPAIATALQQSANICMMPMPLAQEIFYAVLAIIGVQTAENMASDNNKAFRFVAFNDNENTKSLWQKIKSGIIIEIKPKRALILLLVLVVIIGGIIVGPKLVYSFSNTNLKVTTTGEGVIRINRSDLPKSIRNKAKYYGEGFYHDDVDVTAKMAYLRTTQGGFIYNTETYLDPVGKRFDTSYYNEETEVLTLFDKNYNMIAYASYYTKDKNKKVSNIHLQYRLDFDTKKINKEVKRDVESAFKNARVLTSDYFYYKKAPSGVMAMYIKINKLPENMRDITNTSNVWTNRKDSLKIVLKGAVSQYWSSDGSKAKFTGDEIFNKDSAHKNIIAFYHFGEYNTDGENPDTPYNVVAMFSHGKLVAVAYLKDAEVKGSPSAK